MSAMSKLLIAWLLLCCGLVFALVILGGAVRLTGSGLSIVDWRLFGGAIPPLDAETWQRAFDHYRQFPQFQLINPDMTIAGFRFIFWMEYAHRLFGRIVGIVYLLPLLYFLARRQIPRDAIGILCALFLLGGAQGLLGWWMVKSGLVDIPQVSHYRLLAHFMLAVVIYTLLLRTAIKFGGLGGLRDLRAKSASTTPRSLLSGNIALGMILLMLASGALVAATHAGQMHNTFPTMSGAWLPAYLFAIDPWWRNFIDNPITIQFMHRCLAFAVLISIAAFAADLFRDARPLAAWVILTAAAAQIALGIATLLMQVPTALGIAHQAGAMLLLTAVVVLTSPQSK